MEEKFPSMLMALILKGLNFEEGATAKERNKQIGGHKA